MSSRALGAAWRIGIKEQKSLLCPPAHSTRDICRPRRSARMEISPRPWDGTVRRPTGRRHISWRWQLLRIERDLHHGITANIYSLNEGRQQREGRGLHRKPTILKDDPAYCCSVGQLFQKWPSNWIKGHARTLASGDLLYTCHYVFFLSGDAGHSSAH